MGVSTNAQLCFGVSLEEETELPWNNDRYDYDCDKWWRNINGFKYSVEDPFDDDGNWRTDISDTIREELYDIRYTEEKVWDAAHPLPVEIVWHCSGDYQMYIIAARGTLVVARRGYPESIDPASLTVSDEDRDALIGFCEQFGFDGEPGWWLSSMWF